MHACRLCCGALRRHLNSKETAANDSPGHGAAACGRRQQRGLSLLLSLAAISAADAYAVAAIAAAADAAVAAIAAAADAAVAAAASFGCAWA